MSEEMEVVNQFGTEMNSDQLRVIQEVQAAIIIAKKFPRNQFNAEKLIMQSCKRFGLAKSATYLYPKGKDKNGKVTTVTGASIRLAEVLAQNWGNIDFGIRELSNSNGESKVETYCWDLETNVRQTKIFTVKHERKAYGKVTKLEDERDIYEKVANNGARRLRMCILGVIPGDITEKALAQCKATLLAGEAAVPLKERISHMVQAFDGHGVNLEMLEKKLGHKMDLTTAEELGDLHGIFTSIKDGATKRTDWFDFPDSETMASDEQLKAKELSKKLLAMKNEVSKN